MESIKKGPVPPPSKSKTAKHPPRTKNLRRDLAYTFQSIRNKGGALSESSWLAISSFFKYFVVISVLLSYLVPTYLAVFDIRYFDIRSIKGLILHGADFFYVVDTLCRILFEDLHLFRYNYEPSGGSCYRASMAVDQSFHVLKSLIFLAQLFPLEYFALFWKNTGSANWLRMFSYLRLYRVFRLSYIYQWFLQEKQKSCVTLPGRLWRIASILLFIFLIIVYHLVACFWFALNCDPVINDVSPPYCSKTWLQWYYDYPNENGEKGHHPFYAQVRLDQPDPFRRYVGSFVWSLMTIRNSANFYSTPLRNWEMIFCMIFMAFSFVSQFFLILFFLNLTLITDMPRLVFVAEIRSVNSFMKTLGFDYFTKANVMNCLSSVWNRRRVYTDKGLRHLIPPVLEQSTYVERAAPILYASELLQTLTRSAIEALAPSVKINTYFAGDFIIRPDTKDKNMTLLTYGKAQILDPINNNRIMNMTAGSLIGEINIICPTYRSVGLQAMTDCETMVLSWKAVNAVLKVDTAARRQMHIIILRRLDFVQPRLTPDQENSEKKREAEGLKDSANDEQQAWDSLSDESLSSYRSSRNSFDEFTAGNEGEISLMSQFVSLFSYRRYLRMIQFDENEFNEYDRGVAWKLRPACRNRASNSSYKFAKQVWVPAYNFSCLYGFAISKDTMFCQLWNILMFFYIISYSVWFMLEFLVNTKGLGTTVTIINGVTDFVYTMDVVFLLAVFRSPSQMSSKMDVQDFTNQLHVELRTYRAWFDILAVLPFWYLSSTVPAPLSMRLNRLLKFFTIFYKTQELEQNIKLNLLITRMIKHCINIFGFVILTAFFTTLFHCIGTGYANCVLEKNNRSATRYNYNDPEESKFGIFMYWAISVVFGIGFKDLHSISNDSETYILAYLLGFDLLIACWAELIATCMEMSDTHMKYTLTRDWFSYSLKRSYADPKLIKSVDSFLVNQWNSWEGIESLVQQRTTNFSVIGHKIYEEMIVEATVETICSIKLFKWMDPTAMREFCSQTRLINVAPSTVIIPYGNYVKRMYIVRRGVVEVKIISGVCNPVVHKYGPGQCLGFGEMALKLPSMAHITSCTDVQLIMIELSAFDVLAKPKVYGNAWKNLINLENQENYRRILSPEGSENVLRYEDSSSRQPPPLVPALHFYVGPNLEERKLKIRSQKWNRPWIDSPWWIKILRPLTLGVTIHPMKSFEKTFELFRLGVIYMVLFIVPIAEAFPCTKQKFIFLIYFADIVSIIDMFFRFYTAYFDPKYRYHPAQTIRNYLTSAFITDVFGGPIFYYSLQFYLRNYASITFRESVFVYVCKLNRILMIYHIYGYNQQFNEKLRDPSYFKKLLQIIPILMFHGHLMSCLLAIMACPAIDCPYSKPRCSPKTWITNSMLRQDIASQPKFGLTNNPKNPADSEIYTAAFYYTTTTAAGCGFGDFAAVNSSERILMAFTLFFYIIGTAYILARVIAIKPMLDFRLRAFQKQMEHLMDFLVEENVDYHLKTTILGYYEHQWHKSRADNPRDHLITLLPSLREDVGMHFYRLVFNKAPSLQRSCPGFQRGLCDIIQLYYIPMNQIIFREGDVGEMFYVIKSGIVLCSKEAYFGTRIKDYGTLGTFGDFYDYTCVALDQLQLLAFSKQDLAQLAVVFPDDVRYMRDVLRRDRAQPYNKDAKGQKINDSETTVPLKRTMSDLGPHRDYLDTTSTHNIRFHGYKQRLDPAFEDPLCLGIQPLTDFENDFDVSKLGYHQDVYRGFVIYQDSTLSKFLNLLYFIGALGSVITIPYQAAFKNLEIYMFCISYTFDAIYIAKMIVSFFVSSVDQDGSIVGEWGDIVAKYFGRLQGFTFDLMTIFPFEIIAPSQIEWMDPWHLAAILRINRALRIVHVWNFFIPKDYHAGYNVDLNRLKIFRVIFLTCIYLHWMACFLQFWTLIDCKNQKKPNFTECLLDYRNTTWLGTKTEGNFLEYPYIYTAYFIVTTFTAITQGDVKPITESEMIFTSVLAISSKAWLALALADLVNCLYVFMEPKATYRLAVSEALADYKYDGVSDDILSRLSDQFEALWVYNRGLFEPKLVAALPLGLKMDLMFHLHEKHFMKSYLFYNLPDNFCRSLSMKLQRMMVLQGEYIIKSGQFGDSMYFINFGTVTYRKTYPDMNDGGQYKTREGRVNFPRHFGDENAILGTRRHNCCYVAETDVELVFVNHTTLSKLFNSSFRDVMQIVMKRFEKAQYTRRGERMPPQPTTTADPEEYDSSDDETEGEIINISVPKNVTTTTTVIDETRPDQGLKK